MQQAAQLGCSKQAMNLLYLMVGYYDNRRVQPDPELQRAVVDGMLDPQHARNVASELAAASELLEAPRAGSGLQELQQQAGISTTAGRASSAVTALRMSSHRRREVLAGPIGRELRRLARFHDDIRIINGSSVRQHLPRRDGTGVGGDGRSRPVRRGS